jgi:hypothetical protein
MGTAAPYGFVAFGGGKGVSSSLSYLLRLKNEIRSISYVGDLDPAGLRIALSVQFLTSKLGLPTASPAEEVYELMLEGLRALGFPEGLSDRTGGVMKPAETEAFGLYLGGNLAATIIPILRKGRRIPEEAIEPTALRTRWKKLIGS